MYSIDSLIAEATGLEKKKNQLPDFSKETLAFDGYADGAIAESAMLCESVETAFMYDRVKTSSAAAKLRMLKRLSRVYGSTIDDYGKASSVESFINKNIRSTEENEKEKGPNIFKRAWTFIKGILQAIIRAIKNFVMGVISVFTKKYKYYTKTGTYQFTKEEAETTLNKIARDVFNKESYKQISLWTLKESNIYNSNVSLIEAYERINVMSTEINKKFKSSKGTALDYDDRTLGVARISKLMENIHSRMDFSTKDNDIGIFVYSYLKLPTFDPSPSSIKTLISNFSTSNVEACNKSVEKFMKAVDGYSKSLLKNIESYEQSEKTYKPTVFVDGEINKDSIQRGVQSITSHKEVAKVYVTCMKGVVETSNKVLKMMMDFTSKNIKIASIINNAHKPTTDDKTKSPKTK